MDTDNLDIGGFYWIERYGRRTIMRVGRYGCELLGTEQTFDWVTNLSKEYTLLGPVADFEKG